MPDRNLDTEVKECMFHTSLFFHEILKFILYIEKLIFFWHMLWWFILY